MEIFIVAIMLGLVWLYGKIRFAEGQSFGVVTGTSAFFYIMRSRKILNQDEHGNIFRFNDEGGRGDIVVSYKEAPDLCESLKLIMTIPVKTIDNNTDLK
jgi:hypothetical protein